jgi:acetyl esterase/lipase
VGSIVTHRVLAGDVARACQARALVLDYRLAPEDPFPAAVEDSVATYEWLLAQGTGPEQIVLAGDSAGGGLVLSTLVSLRDKRLPLPAAGICLSPWTDLSLSGQSMVDNARKDLVLTEEMLRVFARHYLGDGDPCHPLASPLFADLAGLPPLFVQASKHEILFDDARRVAERARAAGVEAVLDAWEEMVHVWQSYAAFLPESREAIARIGEFVVGHT